MSSRFFIEKSLVKRYIRYDDRYIDDEREIIYCHPS